MGFAALVIISVHIAMLVCSNMLSLKSCENILNMDRPVSPLLCLSSISQVFSGGNPLPPGRIVKMTDTEVIHREVAVFTACISTASSPCPSSIS